MIERVLGSFRLSERCQAGAVDQHDGVCAWRHGAADLVEMQLHCIAVGVRQHQGGSGAAEGADGAEEIGVGVALVGRQPGSRALARPDPGPGVLLAAPRLVLKPDLDPPVAGQMGYVCCERAREVFLNVSSTRGSCLGCRGRPLM